MVLAIMAPLIPVQMCQTTAVLLVGAKAQRVPLLALMLKRHPPVTTTTWARRKRSRLRLLSLMLKVKLRLPLLPFHSHPGTVALALIPKILHLRPTSLCLVTLPSQTILPTLSTLPTPITLLSLSTVPSQPTLPILPVPFPGRTIQALQSLATTPMPPCLLRVRMPQLRH